MQGAPPGTPRDKSSPSGSGVGFSLKRSYPGAGGGANRNQLLHVFVKYVISRAVDMMAADPETAYFRGKPQEFFGKWLGKNNLKQNEICSSRQRSGLKRLGSEKTTGVLRNFLILFCSLVVLSRKRLKVFSSFSFQMQYSCLENVFNSSSKNVSFCSCAEINITLL